jgi:tRNA threonylcarbamoyladenosine biosynthesis protein TsaE
MVLHVGHFAVKSVGKPCEQPGFGAGKVDAGHPDLGESKIARPLPYPGQQDMSFETNAVDYHPPIVGMASRPLRWAGEEDTRAFAERLAARPAISDAFIALHGDLGAGKTQFVRGLLQGLGGDPRTVSSPTFVLLNVYDTGRLPLYHLDAYRIGGSDDFESIGFSELLGEGGVVVVEWASRVAHLLPSGAIQVHLKALGLHDREIRIS